jgi:ABC-type branched-subunit amino acid transport system substrate-binding protein
MTRAAWVVAGCVVLSACGTTVPQAQRATLGSGIGASAAPSAQTDGLGGAAAGQVGGTGGGVAGPVTAGSGNATRPSAGNAPQQVSAGSGRAPVAAAGSSVPSRGRSGFGFTATEIKVGVSISSDGNAAISALGANGVAFPDGKALANTYVDYLNRTGGIAGRKVKPVFYDYRASGNVETSDAAACATWTQDDHVVAALGVRAGTTGTNDALTPCLTKAGVPWMTGRGDQRKFNQYPSTLYAPSIINLTRLERAIVEGLAADGFFTPGAKIGVMYQDNLEMKRAVDEGLVPALRARGLSIAKQAATGNAFTESSNIELQFATAGITHVLFVAPGGAAPWQFMQSASQNQHHYKYGVSSDDYPAVVLEQLAPKDQLATTSGFGYLPVGDVNGQQAPPPTKGLAGCLKVFRDAGYDTAAATSQLAMAYICDPFQALRAGWTGQAQLSTPALRDGIERLGRTFSSAGAFAARFGPGRPHDGAAAYRMLHFGSSCSCFQYAGPVRDTA